MSRLMGYDVVKGLVAVEATVTHAVDRPEIPRLHGGPVVAE